MSKARWNRLNSDIKRCLRCSRLRKHCEDIATVKRKAYLDCSYWGKPVPNMGDPNASLLIVGLAPGAHGANRTGRMFTGDRSGDWLFRALHKSGFANSSESRSRADGLELIDCAITSVAHCAPPGNKPTSDELANCFPFLERTLVQCQPTVILALGSLAWNATIPLLVHQDWLAPQPRRPKFCHGERVGLTRKRTMIGSYHPSQQNTFTGRLTEPMFDSIFDQIVELIRDS